jgi:hypothetical protein
VDVQIYEAGRDYKPGRLEYLRPVIAKAVAYGCHEPFFNQQVGRAVYPLRGVYDPAASD